MKAYEITVEPNLKKIIDDLERIEKKYAKPQERSNKKSCDNCKHYTESWDSDACDGCCGANSKWSGESYPGEFEAIERQGRLDAVMPEQKMMTREEKINLLLQMRKDGEGFLSDNTIEAYDMAIKALDKCDKIEKIIDSDDADFIANYVRGLFAE